MTHSYEHDRELLKMLITSQARYIGMLGPKRRTERMLVELLSDESFKFDDDDLIRLHAPVGLDIGAETPEEIAVSVIAEVRACITGRARQIERSPRAIPRCDG
jgi:xanthine/CO dehydrogenase XdhC/CoxF family maturation factor